MKLPALQQKFVIHFGEMGARWGMNRTVGQIYAVLFLSEQALCADEIVTALGVSRSNVSMGLKELQSWQLVHLEHQPGDRKDYFSTPDDLWQIVMTLVEQRKAREVDPTLTVLRGLQMDGDYNDTNAHARSRIEEATRMIELFSRWYEDMRDVDIERLERLLTMGAAAQKVLNFKPRKKSVKRKEN